MTVEQRYTILSRIFSGLLASGHYTTPKGEPRRTRGSDYFPTDSHFYGLSDVAIDASGLFQEMLITATKDQIAEMADKRSSAGEDLLNEFCTMLAPDQKGETGAVVD